MVERKAGLRIETWKNVQNLKTDLKFKEISDVIDYLLKIKVSFEREIRNSGRTNVIQISILKRILENE